MQDDQSATSTPHPAAPRPRPRLRGIPAVIVGLVVTMMAALAAWTISAGADPLFDDDFEAGDLSAWSTVSGLTVQQSEVHAGDWAARATSSGSGSSASAQRTLATPRSDITVRVFLKALSIGGTDSVNFLGLRTASGTAITELFLTPGRQLGYRDDGTPASTTGQTLVDLGTWNEVTFRVAIDGASSTVQVSLNGAVVPGLSTTTASLGTTPVGQVQLGEDLTGRVYDFAYDDVTVDTGAIATGTPPTSTPPEATGDPVLAAAGDIACDPLNPKIDRQDPWVCREHVVAELIAGDPAITAVAALGDVQYECGGLAAFQQSYDTTWGRLKGITRPAVGNHEYIPSSPSQAATDCDITGMAAGYFSYF